MVFAVFVVALALAPGLISAGDLTGISTFPAYFEEGSAPGSLIPLPLPIPEPVEPELTPEVVPEVEAVVPEIITINPCDVCFEYMTSLIEQLTETVVEPELQPHPMPEVGVLPIPSPGGSGIQVGPRPLGSL